MKSTLRHQNYGLGRLLGHRSSTKASLIGFWNILIFVLGALPIHGFARDMHGRLGLGYNAQFADELPSVAAKYAVTRTTAFEGVLGFDTSTPTRSVFGAKAFHNIFMETNLNFYGFTGLVFSKTRTGSGVEIPAGVGVEFFIPGIESIGWSFETGAMMTNASGDFALKTLGLSFLSAGIRFYF